ncbi:MAG: response regulator, partial [Pseudomonadota bacterium]|nr:response regulator [Pseudomonadota bacterium]
MSQTSTVLIVDDESIGRETLEGLLSQQGYQLVFASNGPEALSQAAEVNPDVILLDIMMPGMDGFEVCQQIRADAFLSEVPIIMVTALDDRASRLRGLEVGADDFISKPFDRVELRTRVRTITHLNRYRRLLLEQEKFVWVVEQAPEAYLVLDNEDQIIYANAKARLYLNLPTDLQEPIYDTFLTLAKQIYRCEPQAAWEQWLNNNFSQLRYLVRPETQTAKAFWLQVDVMRMSSQLVREYLIRLRDITDKMLNERLKWSFQGQVN